MSHGPATDWGVDPAANYKARIGLVLFVLYTAVYAAFVLINVLAPQVMDAVLGDLNLATVYGMGLIFLALVFGGLYNHLCTKAEDRLGKGGAA